MNVERVGRWVSQRRSAIATMLILASIAGLIQTTGPGPKSGPTAVVEPAAFAISPAGEDVARLSPITVTFARAPEEREPEKLFQLEPQPAGSYAWQSARTLLFQPDFPGLVRGSTYTITVPARSDADLPKAISHKFTVAGQLGVQQVIPGDGDTEVPLNAQVIVQFSRSVAPLTTLGAQRNDPIVTFDPPLRGKAEWLNTSIYRFLPEDLAAATTYRMRIAKGLTSAADGALQDDFRWTFTTVTPAVDAISPDDNTKFAGPFQEVVVRFNQPMDRSAANGISVRGSNGVLGDVLTAPIPGKFTWSEGDAVVTFNPTARMAVETKYTVTVAKGLKGAHGSETAAARTSTFTTIALPSISSTSPKNGDNDGGRFGVNLGFATPMDPTTLTDKISVTGFTAKDLEGRISAGEDYVSANVSLKPSSPYTVTFAPGAKDRYGQVMGGYTFSFRTGALPSSVSLALPGYSSSAVYSASTEPILYFQITNLPSVTFTLWPLTGEEGRRLLHDFSNNNQNFTPSQPAMRTWTETVRGEKDETLLGSTSLSGKGPLRKGYYFVRTSGQFASQFAFAVIDTVLVTKVSNDELLAWAIDHDTGAPLQGVTVRTFGGGISPEEARTDANGLASFSVPVPLLGKNQDRSYLLWIDGAGRNAVLSTRWQQGTSPFQFGLPSEYYAREWVGQVYTDRPIYRPGETVEYKGILRTDDDAHYTLPSADTPFRFVMENARGQQVRSETLKLSEFGSFAGSFALPDDAPLGNYSFGVEFKRDNNDWSIASNSFLVAEFRKPEFQVEVSAAKTSYVDGEAIDVRTIASYFFGGAVEGAQVSWSALADPFVLRVPGYESYSFSDYDYWRQSVSRNAVRATGTATTGTDGVGTFRIPATLATSEGAQRFTLSGAVTDQNAQVVSGSTQVTVHPADFYTGVRPAEYIASAGTDARIDLVSVSTDGRVLANRTAVVKVYEREWITTKEQTPGGGRLYRSEPRDTLVATVRATTNAKGEGSVTYRPTRPGTLRIVAEATDGKGRVARSATYLWVWGDSFASWQITNDDAIKLVADRDHYEVGDTADILVPAPFAGGIGLVTIERGKVITKSVQKFPTNSERLRIPITDRSVPNIFVSVVLYWPPTTADPIPRYKVGYVELIVSTSTRVLNVSAKADRAQAKPGDTVRYDIKVTDKSGKGVRSEVSVAVIDKAVLSLQEERGPDGLHAFWFERGLSVSTASSMAVSVDRYNDAIAEPPRQGKGGSGLVSNQTRQDFRNTAYWKAQLVTKDDGTASVDVKMPDNLTTWRMQARAISGDTMVGEGTNELLSTKPLLLRPALPRFLRVGDSGELRVLVRNATQADTQVSVVLKAQGVTVTGDLTRSATVRPSESVVMSWPAKAEAEGTANLTFMATGTGGLEDSVEQELPVMLDVTPETMATGGIVNREGALEAVYLPKFAIQEHGSLTVSVRSALVGTMAEELAILRPDSYEGAERVASRLIASIGVRRAEKTAGGTTVSDGRVASDLAGVIGRQRPDGGWSWCDDPRCQSDPNVTGWALLALGEAQRDGLAVDTSVVQSASRYVFGYVNRTTDLASPADPNQKAFLLEALASAGGRATAATPARALFEQYRAKLASWGKAYLLLALTEAGAAKDDAQVRALFDDLAAATIPSANGNHWEDEPAATRGSFVTTTGTTALAALALARIQPDHALLPQTVRWLVLARAAEGWHTSIDRALGVLALTSYAVSTGELAGDYSYKVLLDDKDVLAGLVTPGAAATSATKSVPLTTLTPGKTNLLAITREYQKPGRLYYTLDLRYVTPAKEVEAVNRGFAISHQYTLIDDPARPISGAKLGDTVRVTLTVMTASDHPYIVIEDLLPSGLEPVDARLKNVDPALIAKLNADQSAAAGRKAGSYFAPWFRWYYSPWQHVELRDDRAVLYATRLAKGVYEYVYYARATTPGNFFVAPAHAEETYLPEVFGRSDSSRFVVTP